MRLTSHTALATIEALALKRSLLPIQKGQVLFRSGDPGDCLYGVVEGSVALTWNAGEMSEIIEPGGTFGIGAFLDPDHRRFGTATALSDGKLLVMNKEEFLFAVQETPMFALEMMQSLNLRLRDLKKRVTEVFANIPD